MKLGAGAVFVAIGLLVLWFAVTGRLSKFVDLWQQAGGSSTDKNIAAPSSESGPSERAIRLADALNIPRNFPAFPTMPSVN